MLSRRDRGDTLIEVLFAITVFSLIVVTGLALMNQGSAASQRALETSLVRQQIDNQTETLRFLHESYVANYQQGFASNPNLTVSGPAGQFYAIVRQAAATGASAASELNDGAATCKTPPGGSFVLNTRTATVITNPTIFAPASTYAQLTFDTSNPTVVNSSNGVWIEPIRSSSSADPAQSNSGFIDFHIRACWDAPGLNVPINLGTIVRLYEPRG